MATLVSCKAWIDLRRDPEVAIALAILCAATVIGLVTIGDYGITTDEWNADDYGVKALRWYASGFTDRTMFNEVEDTLWYYGPWFHMLSRPCSRWAWASTGTCAMR